ncbi:MAG: hypothetical protein GYA39_05840 [Methanothrix sp.]|nr:hypothetical protein [Methanothrix sp.]
MSINSASNFHIIPCDLLTYSGLVVRARRARSRTAAKGEATLVHLREKGEAGANRDR